MKVWLQPAAAPSKLMKLPLPVTLATPGEPPASVCSTRPLRTPMRALAALRSSAPRTVTPSSTPPLVLKARPLAPFSCTVPPLMVPPTSVILPVAALNVSVLAVLLSVPVKLRLPPAPLLKLPSPLLVKVPPRLMVLVASTTLMAPVLLQLAALMVSVPPLRASSVPLLAKLFTPLPILGVPTVSVRAFRLALIVPWLVRLALPPARMRVVPMVPEPCTTAPAPSVRLPPRSTVSWPRLVALPRLMVALLKVWLQPAAAPSKLIWAAMPVTLATPGEPPASVCSTRPLSTRVRAFAVDKSSVPRTVTLSRALLLLVKARPLVPVC